MQLSKSEWAKLICRKADGQDIARYKIDLRLKNVYWALDGTRTLGAIAEEGMYDPAELFALVEQLIGLKLVEITSHAIMDPALLDFLSDILSKELGPMGNILLDDAIRALGFEKATFPESSLSILMDAISTDIADSRKAGTIKSAIEHELKKRKQP